MQAGRPLRFAIFGTGFWSRFQLAAWRELEGVQCVALYNRTRSKAESLGRDFGVDAVYDDPEKLLAEAKPDFIDVITDQGTHRDFVLLAAKHRVPVICQKPFADSVEQAEEMLAACREAGVPLLIHENWRWQRPIRELKAVLDSGAIGDAFRARVHYANSFPVFDNQPFLRELERFLLMDIGTHVLDTARFLFGEPRTVYCRTSQANPTIRGEDVATAMLGLPGGVTVNCEMSYASRTELERFPQTYFFVEGTAGSVELGVDYWLRTTTEAGTLSKRVPPPRYPWADPAYDVVHASIVDCNRDLLAHLSGDGTAETTGEDNLKTFRLVDACYASADRDEVVRLQR